MNYMYSVCITLILLTGCAEVPVAWGSTLRVNPERLVEIIGPVDTTIIKQAENVFRLSQTEGPIFVLFNSPGGDVSSGLIFIDALNAARKGGTRIVCLTGVLAASMAFNIQAHCDSRYALPHSLLLFHPMRISGQGGMTTEEVELYSVQMLITETKIKRELRNMMGVREDWFERYYRLEYLWEASSLVKQTPRKWLRIVDRIEGVENLYKVQRQSSFFFGSDSFPGDGQGDRVRLHNQRSQGE